MKKKTLLGLFLAGTLVIGSLAGCGGEKGAGNDGDKESDSASGEKETIEFWYHDGNPTSNAIFEEVIKMFEEDYPQYEVKYVGLPSDSYLQKYNVAVEYVYQP
ncbi:MAG: hypothetical protein U0N90_11385 [Blautia sp.]|jgi:multiple sugar transport system substrate-binding protein